MKNWKEKNKIILLVSSKREREQKKSYCVNIAHAVPKDDSKVAFLAIHACFWIEKNKKIEETENIHL